MMASITQGEGGGKVAPMPVYEFRCKDCRKKFTVVQPISRYSAGTVKCPKCGRKKAVERQWSPVYAVTSKKS